MRSNDLQLTAGLCDSVQLVNETKNVGDMLDYMPANYLVKFIVSKRVWKDSQVVNDICMTRSICVDTDGAGKLVLTTSDIKYLFLR